MGREMEGVSRGRGHMYTYGWFMWMYGRNQPDNKAIIFQLKNKLIEKKKIWDPCLVVWSSRTSFNSLNWFVELMSLKKKRLLWLLYKRNGEPWAILGWGWSMQGGDIWPSQWVRTWMGSWIMVFETTRGVSIWVPGRICMFPSPRAFFWYCHIMSFLGINIDMHPF